MLLTPVGFFYGARLTTLSLVASNTASNSVGLDRIVCPLGVQEGDLIIHIDVANNISGISNSGRIPTGFTQFDTRNQSRSGADNRILMRLSYKISNGTEGGTDLLGMNGWAGKTNKDVLVFRGNFPLTSAIPTWQNTGASGTGTVNLVLPGSTGTAPQLAASVFIAYSPSNFTSSHTPTEDIEFISPGVAYGVQVRVNLQLTTGSVANIAASCTKAGGLNGIILSNGYFTLGID